MADTLKNRAAGTLTAADAGDSVVLAGWVARRRDHGGVIFVDLRDQSGVVQVVLNPDDQPAPASDLQGLRTEFCISIEGAVRLRPADMANPELPTGEIEVVATTMRVLSPSEPLPFQIDDRSDVDEAKRLQYRYLDLRRPAMADNVRARSKTIRAMRT